MLVARPDGLLVTMTFAKHRKSRARHLNPTPARHLRLEFERDSPQNDKILKNGDMAAEPSKQSPRWQKMSRKHYEKKRRLFLMFSQLDFR